MSEITQNTSPSRTFWIVGGLALVWNLIGVATYLMSVMTSEESLAAMSEAERALFAGTPAWATGAYAIAVFGGTLASVALLLRKAWAVPLFALSLLAILMQMAHALIGTDLLAVKGTGAAFMPVLIIAIAVYLLWYAQGSKRLGWLG